MSKEKASLSLECMADGLYSLIVSLEMDDTEAIVASPGRFVKAYGEILSGYETDVSTLIKHFEHVESDDLVIVKDIPFFSMCKHHFLPFFGKAHVGYLPNELVIGLSKIPRIVKAFSRRMQLQEKLGNEICTTLFKSPLNPKGVIVVLEAQHMCKLMRGAEAIGSSTITSTILGSFKENSDLKREFFHLIGRNGH